MPACVLFDGIKIRLRSNVGLSLWELPYFVLTSSKNLGAQSRLSLRWSPTRINGSMFIRKCTAQISEAIMFNPDVTINDRHVQRPGWTYPSPLVVQWSLSPLTEPLNARSILAWSCLIIWTFYLYQTSVISKILVILFFFYFGQVHETFYFSTYRICAKASFKHPDWCTNRSRVSQILSESLSTSILCVCEQRRL